MPTNAPPLPNDNMPETGNEQTTVPAMPAVPAPTPEQQSAPQTPPTTETPAEAIAEVKSDVAVDAAAARAEYDKLVPAAQAKFHEMLNSLEQMFEVSAGAIHTLFGAKK